MNRFDTPITSCNVDELREHLRFRDGDGFACFWPLHENGRERGVMFSRREAYVHFFPGDGSAGAFALPAVEPDNPDQLVEFLADNGEPTPLQRWMIVNAAVADEAIVLFYESGERLSSVAWEELVTAAPVQFHRPPKRTTAAVFFLAVVRRRDHSRTVTIRR